MVTVMRVNGLQIFWKKSCSRKETMYGKSILEGSKTNSCRNFFTVVVDFIICYDYNGRREVH